MYNGCMKRYKIWIIEIIIWVLLIGIIGYNLYAEYKSNSDRTYIIYFNDAAGLVKGAPVRLMGINIGYVKEVKIQGDKVLVVFLASKKDIEIPRKAIANIEFYGLGASTSLELKPLQNSNSGKSSEIIVGKSYRIQDYWYGKKLTANTMINLYGAMGRNIDKSNILNNKQILFQSDTIMEFINIANKINSEETVIINKLHTALED